MQFDNFGISIFVMELKVELFISWSPHEDIAKFINSNNIKKADILMITQGSGSYTLFYYA
jgi:hypothetical protein